MREYLSNGGKKINIESETEIMQEDCTLTGRLQLAISLSLSLSLMPNVNPKPFSYSLLITHPSPAYVWQIAFLEESFITHFIRSEENISVETVREKNVKMYLLNKS